jgi:rhodanese-related sulfurtransferase
VPYAPISAESRRARRHGCAKIGHIPIVHAVPALVTQGRTRHGERGVEGLLRRARSGLSRLAPGEVPAELAAGAILIDIRPEPQRRREGEPAEAVTICRNVLEWRCDPLSRWRDRRLADPERRPILICAEGCQSSLAAATLQQLGRPDATDVIGGFAAWRAAGLPVRRPALR